MLVDSNIVVYAINSTSPKHIKAQKFLQNNLDNLELAHQNIFETLRVLTHPKFPHPMKPKDATLALERIMEICMIIHPDYRTHQITLELIKKYQISSDKIFDGYLVATALSNNIDTIVTDNVKDLGKLRKLK